jgi:hypothetical protein
MSKKIYLEVPKQGAYSAAATQFLSRIADPGTPRKNLIAALIDGCVTDGVWSLIYGLWIRAADNSTTAKTNWKSSSYTSIQHGTLTFTADHGFTGDGSTGYLDNGFDNKTGFSQNSWSFGYYCLNARTTYGFMLAMGADDGTAPRDIGGRWASSPTEDIFGEMGGLYAPAGNTALSNTAGMYVASVTGSGTAVIYRNGNITPSITGTGSTVAVTTAHNIYEFARASDPGPGADSFSTDTHSASFVAQGLTATQASNLASRINTYHIGLGINVYGTLSLAATPSGSTQVGVSYSQTNVASGGTGPYTYSVSAGSLPTSTTLNTSTGTVSGTPTVAAAFSYAITVTDNVSATAAQTSSGTIAASGGISSPSFATAFGFTNQAFFDDFLSISTIDMGKTFAPGFKWYSPNPGNSTSTITLSGSIVNPLAPHVLGLSTAANQGSFGPGFYNTGSVGQLFSGTDGYYAEVKLEFTPSTTTNEVDGWSLYDFLGWYITRVAGQSLVPNANPYAEIDPVDSWVSTKFIQAFLSYDNAAHVPVDWNYNIGPAGVPLNIFQSMDFSIFHTYGVLVVPVAKNGGTGVMRFYVDRVQQGPDITWTPGSAFSTTEFAHSPLNIGANSSTASFFDYVAVWNSGAGWDGPTSSLTHRWPMRDTQVVGTSVKDVVGTLHGTAGSGISSTVGPLCTQARLSNGTTAQGYITLPSAPIASLTSAWSIAAWVKMTSPSTAGGSGVDLRICQLDDGTNKISFVVDHTTTVGALAAIKNGPTSLFATAAAVFTAGFYNHFVVTFDGTSTYTVYGNGRSVSLGGTAQTGTPTTGSCFMASSASAADSYAGAMSQFTTYTKALSAAEVVTLYNSYDP